MLQKYSDVYSQNHQKTFCIVIYSCVCATKFGAKQGRLDSPQIFPLHAKIYFSRATNSETSRRQNIFFHEVLLYFFFIFSDVIGSMIFMEITMNSMDWLFTGGAILVWWVIPIMLVVGFIAPWPYNYWRLKKYDLTCN